MTVKIPDPIFVLDALILEREHLLATLLESLENLLSPLLVDDGDPITVTHHLQQLQSIDMWPTSKAFRSINIKTALRKVRLYRACSRAHCGCARAQLVVRIQGLANIVQAQQRGLCLSCHKKGKISVEKGNCTARLRGFCDRVNEEPIFNLNL